MLDDHQVHTNLSIVTVQYIGIIGEYVLCIIYRWLRLYSIIIMNLTANRQGANESLVYHRLVTRNNGLMQSLITT